jgi:hypothetical protein
VFSQRAWENRMSIPRFAEYAAAFEKAFASDDWSVVEPFFTEDAEYEVGLGPPFTPEAGSCLRGRDAVLGYFKNALDAFDRRFATREVVLLDGPRKNGDAVWIRGRADYTSPVAPDLSFELEEIATFAGDRICRLEDRYDDATIAEVDAYLAAHAEKLRFGAS